MKPLHDLDTTALHDLLPEIPFWVKSPDYERVSSFVFYHLYDLQLQGSNLFRG